MAAEIWINIGPGNGLLPDGTKPLPEPMVMSHCQGVWYSPESVFTPSTQRTILYNDLESYTFFRITAASPRDQQVNSLRQSDTYMRQ